MRKILCMGARALAGFGLSGCAVATIGGAVVGGAVSVASTAVHVTGDVVSGAPSGAVLKRIPRPFAPPAMVVPYRVPSAV